MKIADMQLLISCRRYQNVCVMDAPDSVHVQSVVPPRRGSGFNSRRGQNL